MVSSSEEGAITGGATGRETAAGAEAFSGAETGVNPGGGVMPGGGAVVFVDVDNEIGFFLGETWVLGGFVL
jgi:hypothetical protein